MMKIWHVEWYNEDDYGPMEGVWAVVQAEGQQSAIDKARKFYELKDMNGLEERYEKLRAEDITDVEILTSGMRTW